MRAHDRRRELGRWEPGSGRLLALRVLLVAGGLFVLVWTGVRRSGLELEREVVGDEAASPREPAATVHAVEPERVSVGGAEARVVDAVTRSGVGGARVVFFGLHGDRLATAVSEGDGVIARSEAPGDGVTRVLVVAAGYEPLERAWTGAHDGDLEVVAGCSIEGTVTSRRGQPLADTWLQLRAPGLEHELGVRTDASGTFRFRSVPRSKLVTLAPVVARPSPLLAQQVMTPEVAGGSVEGLRFIVPAELEREGVVTGAIASRECRLDVTEGDSDRQGAPLGSCVVSVPGRCVARFQEPLGRTVRIALVIGTATVSQIVLGVDEPEFFLALDGWSVARVVLTEAGERFRGSGIYWCMDPGTALASATPGRFREGMFELPMRDGTATRLELWFEEHESLAWRGALPGYLELPVPARGSATLRIAIERPQPMPASHDASRVRLERLQPLEGFDAPLGSWLDAPERSVTPAGEETAFRHLPAGRYRASVIDGAGRIIGTSPGIAVDRGASVDAWIAIGVSQLEILCEGTQTCAVQVIEQTPGGIASELDAITIEPGDRAELVLPASRFMIRTTCDEWQDEQRIELAIGETRRIEVRGRSDVVTARLVHRCAIHGDAVELACKQIDSVTGTRRSTATLRRESDGWFAYRGTAGEVECRSPCGIHVVRIGSDVGGGAPIELRCPHQCGIEIDGLVAHGTHVPQRIVLRSLIAETSGAGAEVSVVPDADGTFSAALPAAGDHLLIEMYERTLVPRVVALADGETLSIVAPDEGVTFEVVDGSGAGVDGARIVVLASFDELTGRRTGAPGTLPLGTAVTDAAGRGVVAPLRSGRYSATITTRDGHVVAIDSLEVPPEGGASRRVVVE